MRNIELKAQLCNRKAALAVCGQLEVTAQGDIRQVDTYFPVSEGRLKFRESDPGDDYLVYYRRPDVASAKRCDYQLEIVERSLKDVLANALGVLTIVEKVRTLFLWENVRLHLDQVKGLGDFIEFEAVLSDKYDDADGYRKLELLQGLFGISQADVRKTSYLEMMLERGGI